MQIKADVNRKAFVKIVQKTLSQNKMKGVEACTSTKQKRTFKKIGKNLVLLKLFSRQVPNSNFGLSDKEERFILWQKQLFFYAPLIVEDFEKLLQNA